MKATQSGSSKINNDGDPLFNPQPFWKPITSPFIPVTTSTTNRPSSPPSILRSVIRPIPDNKPYLTNAVDISEDTSYERIKPTNLGVARPQIVTTTLTFKPPNFYFNQDFPSDEYQVGHSKDEIQDIRRLNAELALNGLNYNRKKVVFSQNEPEAITRNNKHSKIKAKEAKKRTAEEGLLI